MKKYFNTRIELTNGAVMTYPSRRVSVSSGHEVVVAGMGCDVDLFLFVESWCMELGMECEYDVESDHTYLTIPMTSVKSIKMTEDDMSIDQQIAPMPSRDQIVRERRARWRKRRAEKKQLEEKGLEPMEWNGDANGVPVTE